MADSAPRSSGAGVPAVLCAALVFSFGFILVKLLGLPAPTIAFHRLWIGTLVLGLVALALRSPWPAHWSAVIWAGVCFGGHQLLYIAATQATSIAIVTLLGSLQPLLVGLVSRRALGEAVPRALFGWACVGAGGIVLVVWANFGDDTQTLLGDLLACANLLVFTAFFLLSKRARLEGAHTLTLTASVYAIALCVVAPGLLFVETRVPVDTRGGLLLVLLALGPGNGHLLLNWAHPRVSAALTALTLGAVPLLSSLWAHLVFGEPYGPWHVAGMLLCLAAIEGGRRSELRLRRA